ncbi:carbohydrate kinase family protein [Pedobacter sp. MC2016-24]|uniref:carbohydrate kinase family protein n=1 Tax=Pedobacter sp. MC2016-24 TaxID=2780090 RepID=UPI001882080D|nr:carbohydrate kinase family protein [Pedobacter sp. MC2016-24]MBE9601887.1 carbohydrate kinase family protein [Pedobacter sp. MC2016-24]
MNKEKELDVMVAGYLGIDLIPDFKKTQQNVPLHDLLKPGKLTEIDGLQLSLGGVVANTGIALKKFNKRVYLNGLTGNDFMGRIIQDWLERYQIATGIKMLPHASTAFGIVIAPPGVDRIFLESPGCNEIFSKSDIDFKVMQQSKIFHFGYPPLLKNFFVNNGNQLHSLFSEAQQLGVVTSLDLSLPDPQSEGSHCDWPAIMKKVLPFTDIFVPSIEELLNIMMPEEYHRIAAAADENDMIDFIPLETIQSLGSQMISLGVKILLLKMAHRGAYLFTGDVSAVNEKGDLQLDTENWNHITLHCDAYPVDPDRFKNASGAGDTAAAAFLTAILEGESAFRSLHYACIAGRNNLYCNDMYQELDSWESMTNEINITVF